MSLQILPDLEQGSDEWFEQRRGMVTASVVGKLISQRQLGAFDYDCPSCGAVSREPCRSKRAPGGPIKTLHPERAADSEAETVIEVANNEESRGLTLLLAAERITDHTDPTYVSDDMWRGKEDEPRAIEVYSEHYAPVRTVGLMVRDDWGFKIGYSPDGLVDADRPGSGQDAGLVEVKSRRQKKQLATVLDDEVPAENLAQLQCGLLVSGRAWIDYISYSGGMHLWRKRVYPDPRWFEAIVSAVAKFESTAAAMVATYKDATRGLPMTERVTEMEIIL